MSRRWYWPESHASLHIYDYCLSHSYCGSESALPLDTAAPVGAGLFWKHRDNSPGVGKHSLRYGKAQIWFRGPWACNETGAEGLSDSWTSRHRWESWKSQERSRGGGAGRLGTASSPGPGVGWGSSFSLAWQGQAWWQLWLGAQRVFLWQIRL